MRERSFQSSTVSVPVGRNIIEGELILPDRATGSVIFAHGSGSSRHSPRNQYVAGVLNRGGLSTLLIDLLTVEEEIVDSRTAEHRFNIGLLAQRLMAATDWARARKDLSGFSIGYFGASTGAAAALIAAAERSDVIDAVVSRGGRPDLAGDSLEKVAAPTLLIVGELDREVIALNRQAARVMHARTEIAIVPRATHLFEEEGALEQVALLARGWFERNLIRGRAA